MPPMNGERVRIEIFQPFGDAFEWMKRVLFRPFDLKKWLVLGFAAFIAGNSGGGFSGNFNPRAFKDMNAQPSGAHFNWSNLGPWWIAGIIVAAAVLVVLILVLMWVVCRGRFVFADCVVKNRAAIVDPWHEFRREGNSYFLFTLAVGFASVLIFVLLTLIILVPLGIFAHGRAHAWPGLGGGIAIGCLALLWFVFVIFLAVVTHFMVPVMYRQRCAAFDAFGQVMRLITNHLGSFVLLILFGIVLFLGFVVLSTVVTCATCCIGALPYISSVLLLPVLVCLAAFKLFFLRQFGNEYDVWNGTPPSLESEPPPLPPAPPATQS
jgi:hypothetical protein